MCQEPSTYQAETTGIWNVGLRLVIPEIIGDKDRKNKRFYFIKVEINKRNTFLCSKIVKNTT